MATDFVLFATRLAMALTDGMNGRMVNACENLMQQGGSVAKSNAAKRLRRIALALAIVIAVLLVACVGYLMTGRYAAQEKALAALQSDAEVTVTQTGSTIVFEGPDADPANTRGLVFYPGGKVSEQAYAPLMHELARSGWFCVIVDAPFDFALLNINAAEAPISTYSQVECWYVGGHSLGGVAASWYADGHRDAVSGLLFLAAFTTIDLSDSNLEVISVYGTNDGVLDRDSYAEGKGNLPSTVRELAIEGGNHAQFGDYGEQEGDGAATISAEEQVRQTVAFVNEAG